MASPVSAAITEPYAEALLSLAQTQGLVSRFSEDTSLFLELLASSLELRSFISNPLTKGEAKKAVIRQLLNDKVHSYFLNFLLLLVDRRRIFVAQEIAEQYQALVRKLQNIVLAEVTTTVELTEAQREAVVHKVKAISGASQVELACHLDPSLIGGVIVKVGSQVLDASLRGQLRRLSNSLLAAS
ncbi:ATP synthase F1 subunit delta [Thermosynechococcaceae cyanobacterium BACA0444]|uniref:ATP synthase subunit delta n=1 Tax=Pseudocalidococcus azoricus BACA0444 TaxID=2918990 RepID=A0AAE4JZM6_9CYAN|nr:ATP synthase F1 subunit delta [Pseudocalidococcus azoricus]MDS3862304.1 ATP synthase F1 subunit delta [Pseudocalidococcus azoricus BACA0444]